MTDEDKFDEAVDILVATMPVYALLQVAVQQTRKQLRGLPDDVQKKVIEETLATGEAMNVNVKRKLH